MFDDQNAGSHKMTTDSEVRKVLIKHIQFI